MDILVKALSSVSENYAEIMASSSISLERRLRDLVKRPTIERITEAYKVFVRTSLELKEKVERNKESRDSYIGEGMYGVLAQMAVDISYKSYDGYSDEEFVSLNAFIMNCIKCKYHKILSKDKMSNKDKIYVTWVESLFEDKHFMQDKIKFLGALQNIAETCGSMPIVYTKGGCR